MPAPPRQPGSGSWARAQQIGPEFRPTMGWVLERSGGRWWRLPLALLTFAVVLLIGFLIVSFITGIARGLDAAEGPLTAFVAVGLAVSVAVGVFAAARVARPPLQWVTRPHLMAVKTDIQRRLEAGAEGEFITGGLLRPLENEGYIVRHSVEIPGEERPIDHIVVGPTGLFVVESKYYVEDVRKVGDRLFGDGTPLDQQVALLRHQCGEMWRRVSAEAGISVRGVFSMVGNQTTPAFALDGVLWCAPGRELGAIIRAWEPRRLEPELVQWLALRIDRAFGLSDDTSALPPPPVHRVLEGTVCDRPGCDGTRTLRRAGTGPHLECSQHEQGACDRRWTLDGWPLATRTG